MITGKIIHMAQRMKIAEAATDRTMMATEPPKAPASSSNNSAGLDWFMVGLENFHQKNALILDLGLGTHIAGSGPIGPWMSDPSREVGRVRLSNPNRTMPDNPLPFLQWFQLDRPTRQRLAAMMRRRAAILTASLASDLCSSRRRERPARLRRLQECRAGCPPLRIRRRRCPQG